MTAVVKGPSRIGYWLSAACALLAVAGFLLAMWGVVRAGGEIEDFVTLRGSAEGTTVYLDEPGDYTVFIEGLFIDQQADIPAVVLFVEHPNGSVDRITPNRGADGEFAYDLSSFSGAELGSFEAEEPGSYRIRLESSLGDDPNTITPYTLRVGQIDVAGPLVAVIAGFGAVALFSMAAVVLLIATIVRRSNHRRRMAMPYGYAPPGGWAPPPPSGWAPPPTAPPGSNVPGAWSGTNPPGWWTPPSETPGRPAPPAGSATGPGSNPPGWVPPPTAPPAPQGRPAPPPPSSGGEPPSTSPTTPPVQPEPWTPPSMTRPPDSELPDAPPTAPASPEPGWKPQPWEPRAWEPPGQGSEPPSDAGDVESATDRGDRSDGRDDAEDRGGWEEDR